MLQFQVRYWKSARGVPFLGEHAILKQKQWHNLLGGLYKVQILLVSSTLYSTKYFCATWGLNIKLSNKIKSYRNIIREEYAAFRERFWMFS